MTTGSDIDRKQLETILATAVLLAASRLSVGKKRSSRCR